MLPRILFSTLCLLVASCGGGGGSSGAPAQVDTTAPVISLQGESSVVHPLGTAYVDPGATATDAVDGTVAVTQSGTVADEEGTYTITYSASDSSGNSSSITRTVVVTGIPEISKFSFLTVHNPSLSSDIDLTLGDGHITGRLEASAEVDNLVATIVHDGSEITVEGVSQTDGVTANDYTYPLTYRLTSDSGFETTYSVDITQFTGLPMIYLTTENNAPIESKEDYIEGRVSVDGWRDHPSLDEMDMKIRGRGNSTWFLHPKKPFQMKLDDKEEFLGMPNHKKWLFLAEYSDKTLLRNTIVFEMGYISSLDWTPASTFAEVFLNGEYNGTYNITQKVEEADNRVALGDDGYLLEIDQLDRLDDDDVYISTEEFPVIAIKEPKLEWNDAKYAYIKSLITQFESKLFGANFADPDLGYARYIDIDSFIDWFLINEIVKNQDSMSYSSIYLNVMPGEKIKMGPLWDFDLSFGNVDYSDATYAEGFWVRWNPWINRLLEDPVFANKVKARFAYYRDNESYILEKIDQYAEKLKWAQQENNNKWQTFGQYVWPNPVYFDSHDKEVAHLKSWYQSRMDWLDTALNNL